MMWKFALKPHPTLHLTPNGNCRETIVSFPRRDTPSTSLRRIWLLLKLKCMGFWSTRWKCSNNLCSPYLPSFVCSPVVGVVLCDVGVDAAECELFVWSGSNRLHYELRVGIRRFRLVLRSVRGGRCGGL